MEKTMNKPFEKVGKTSRTIAKILRIIWIIAGATYLIGLYSSIMKIADMPDYVIIYENPKDAINHTTCYEGKNYRISSIEQLKEDKYDQWVYEELLFKEKACVNHGKYIQWKRNEESEKIKSSVFGFFVCTILFFFLFKPLIGFYDKVQFYIKGGIKINQFKKNRRNCLICAIVLNFLSISVLSISKDIPLIGNFIFVASAFVMIPQYIFIRRTKHLLQNSMQPNQEEQNNSTEIIL